jgi:uncharacterized membrane-anchored protein
MTRPPIRAGLLAAFLFAAGAALLAVVDNERILDEGRVVLAELAPVDPRSLMQGDYMALRYAIDDELAAVSRTEQAPVAPAYAFVALDGEGRARLVGTGDRLPPDAQQVAMRLRSRDGAPSIGPNAFFFQEGHAAAFEGARWGEFRVDAGGKALLTHLRDASLQRLGEIRR